MNEIKNQPEALRLADAVDRFNRGVCSQAIYEEYCQVSAEMRRLYARVQELEAAESRAATLSDEQIRAVFLANGFTIKPGCDDLKPYVYKAARALLAVLQQK